MAINPFNFSGNILQRSLEESQHEQDHQNNLFLSPMVRLNRDENIAVICNSVNHKYIAGVFSFTAFY